MLLKCCEGSWGLEGKLEEKRAKEESSWGGEMNLQRGKAVTLFNFTFPYRILNILITHSRFASNTAFLLLTADCFPSQGEELVYRGILTF